MACLIAGISPGSSSIRAFRYSSHVAGCKHCQAALKAVRLARTACLVLLAAVIGAGIAAAVFGAPMTTAKCAGLAAAALVAAGGALFLNQFERQFTFADYVHAKVK